MESALLSTLVALSAGFAVVFVCIRYLKVKEGALHLGALFAPSLIYLGLSGRLVEFKGLGLEAKFQQAATMRITPSAVKPSAPSASGIRDKSAARAVFGIGSEVVLITAPSIDKPASRQAVLDVAVQIYPGLLQGGFELLAVLDESDRLLGYFPRSYFLDLLRIELEQTIRGERKQFDSRRVGDQLEQTQLWDIVEFPRMRAQEWGNKTTVRLSDSNAQALSVMAAAGLDSIVVVDNAGKYAGIVRRSDIVSQLVSSLAGVDTPANPKP